MVDNAVLGAAVLLWLAVAYEAVSLTRQRSNRARGALLLTFVALALAATFFVPSVYLATQDLTGVPNLADLIARCAVLTASLGAQALLLHLTQEPTMAMRKSRRRAVALASAMVLLVVLFTLAPVHETGTLRLTSDFGGSPWVIGYLVVFAVYLGIALVDVFRGGLRYAPKAGTPISTALHLIAIGCAFGLLYVVEKIGYLIAVLLGGSPSAAVESSVARMLAVLGGLFVLAGSLVPALYPAWRRTVHRVTTTYRAHRELYPLWSALREINPEIALDPAPSQFRDRLRVRDLDFRLYRRVIEIRDGRLALRPFLDADVARRAREDAIRNGLTDDEMEAAVEARVLAAGIESAREKRKPANVLTASQHGGKDFMAEVEWLLRVVRVPLPSDLSAPKSLAAPPGRLKAGPA
jgi:hypothetical protein